MPRPKTFVEALDGWEVTNLTGMSLPCRQPTLIVPAPTGIVYQNQTGGCACNRSTVEGYIVPLPEVKDYHCFNPRLWYDQQIITLPPPPAWRRLQPRIVDKQEKDHDDWIKVRNVHWWDEVCDDITEAFKGLIRVRKNVPQQEAWFQVRAKLAGVLSKQGDWTNAILTWQNCD